MTEQYYFLLRPWNASFFLLLEERIKTKQPNAQFLYLSMQKEAIEEVLAKGKTGVYLPDSISSADTSKESLREFDRKMQARYGYGVLYVYETERYRPQNRPDEFVAKHYNALLRHIKTGGTLFSMTCDHFVIMLAGYLNELQGGKNYYLQPTGFPSNSNVVLSNPWDLNPVYSESLDTAELDAYIATLSRPPQETISYMKQDEPIRLSVSEKLSNRWRLVKKWSDDKALNGPYHYLEHPQAFPFFQSGEVGGAAHPASFPLETLLKNTQGKVFYYPLQYEPEMSILAYSPFYKDQIELIRLIAMSLSMDDLLILKENPKMIGRRKPSFYEAIAVFSNVLWVNPSENSREIIRRVDKVISITGTACIEATCLGVNSLMVGYPPFRELVPCKLMSEQTISAFKKELFNFRTAEEIKAHLFKGWSNYGKAVFIGDIIPKFDGKRQILRNQETLADALMRMMEGKR